ncbi:glutamate--tRNA ligase [Candidatus Saccharibacteria bacterium]|nr:glutamate--tRNA ligase [Candidatus Saccharibacteria bacterium]MCB9821420.1 glutamate--tRNA ligase [Candidatus Nomurabacteria bacterium]
MNQRIRTRFAPSPTGMLHIGSLRTALFSYLWARKNNGEFIVRLEDTDQARIVEGAAEQILSSMGWLGMDWDYGPDKPSPEFGSCIQSERNDDYTRYIQALLDSGVAYYDWTSPEQLESLRAQAQANKQPFVFRKNMATLEGETGKAVIRIAIPDQTVITWTDHVKGLQSWRGKDIGDFVAIKSDGFPTYQFANVVDDHLMEITHVIRADEWLSSTPKHLFLYDAFGWQRPEFAHVPPILGPDGKKKLSKRDGAKDAAVYATEGYLPEAVMNYLALLGWNPGTDQEIFSPDQLVSVFELSRIQKSGAKFDPVRLDWMNGMHIRNMDPSKRLELAESWWPKEAVQSDKAYKQRVLDLVYERLKKFADLAEYSRFFFARAMAVDVQEIEQETKFTPEEQANLLVATIDLLQASDFTETDLEHRLYGYAKENDLKVGKYFMLIRLMITGSRFSPGLFETLNTLGKAEVLERLKT